MTIDLVLAPAAIVAVIAVAVGVASRWRPALILWWRALIVSAVFVGAASWVLAGRTQPDLQFVAGFTLCAAAHRWIDAITRRNADAEDAAT